ncbi:MAG: hypothetical protein HGA19_24025 [Oscillochloris sp.]|nr:hypothetical protein [Oscillochloris sp.]
MLRQLHHHVIAALAGEHSATLATYGPAGLHAHVLPCAVVGMRLYVLLPSTSDQLLNLEVDPDAVVVTSAWMVRGRAYVCTSAECPAELDLWRTPESLWSVVVEVLPCRVTIAHQEGWGASETVDLNR